jgi:hypothetical protein
MTTRWVTVFGSVVLTLGLASQVSAEILASCWNSIVTDVKRRQCWPEPFAGPDRASVRIPLARQVSNGWRKQNMLTEFHFDGSNQLNDAGRNKLRWILNTCPQQHRAVFVHTGDTNEQSANRMAAVQQFVAENSPNNVPPIAYTSISDQGWPASQIDAIDRAFMKQIPEQVKLPAQSSANTGAGTSAQ